MPVEHPYFTWPDGVLGYRCAGCGECCKGLGIGLDGAGGQVARLSEHYPELIGFMRRRGATWTAFNPRGRCWFLDREGLCLVEREHGRRVKPASCRLFPFNRVFLVGGTMIVDYNSVICPLHVVEHGDPAAVTHAEVLVEIESIADEAVVGTQLQVDEPERDGIAFAQRERRIAAACFAEAGSASPSIEAVWNAQSATPPGFDQAVAAMSAAGAALLERPWRQPSGRTLQHALLLTPSLRFNELFGPRRYRDRGSLDPVLPGMWLAWLHFVADGAALARRELGMQESTSIWGEQAALAYVMARWNDRPVMARGPVELPSAGDPSQVVRRFGEACVGNRSRGRTLGDLLAPLYGDQSSAERIALTRLLEPLLPRLRFPDQDSGEPGRRAQTKSRRRRR